MSMAGGVTGNGRMFVVVEDALTKPTNDLTPEDAFFQCDYITDIGLNKETIVITINIQDYRVMKEIGIPFSVILK